MNAFVAQRLLSGTSHHSACFTTSTNDSTRIESGPPPPEITFACFSAPNVHYGLFGELQERPPPALQITTRRVIATHDSKYGKLLMSPEDQLMLDNNEIVRDVREAGKSEDKGDKETAKDNDGTVDEGD